MIVSRYLNKVWFDCLHIKMILEINNIDYENTNTKNATFRSRLIREVKLRKSILLLFR